jgi:type IV pilus assembly protein PilB
VILVGEVRDLETAQIAIRAALTGHLVFSTLHTNDAPSTIARLSDMGIPAFLVSASVILIVAQRLIRKVCQDCKESYLVDPEALAIHGYVPEGPDPVTCYKGKGCQACNYTGMRGRMAIYEVMPATPEIKELILRGAPTSEIKSTAVAQGMKTLRQAGLQKVLEGTTTLEETLRVTFG